MSNYKFPLQNFRIGMHEIYEMLNRFKQITWPTWLSGRFGNKRNKKKSIALIEVKRRFKFRISAISHWGVYENKWCDIGARQTSSSITSCALQCRLHWNAGKMFLAIVWRCFRKNSKLIEWSILEYWKLCCLTTFSLWR